MNLSRQLFRIVSIASLSWMSWMGMMLIHEIGHVLGAFSTGGRVSGIHWHPLTFSRTVVISNPHPLIEMWAGAIFGCLAPVAVAGMLSVARFRLAWLFWFFAGFCLIANGVYLGTGAFDPVGDARDLRLHGTPPWLLGLFSLLASPAGLYLLNQISPRLGFGRTSQAVSPRLTLALVLLAVLMTEYGFLLGVP